MTAEFSRFVGASILAFVTLGLVGCNSLSSDQNEIGGNLMFESIKYVLWKGEKPRPEGQALAQFPYALNYIRIVDGADAPLVLAKVYRDGRQLWVSSDNVGVVTENGRIHQFLNYQSEIAGWRSDMADPLPEMLSKKSAIFEYKVDLIPSFLTNVDVLAKLENRGKSQITIGHKYYTTNVITEEIKIDKIDFEATNKYWLDVATGKIVRSVQYLPPEGERVRIEVVKPYAP